MNLKQGKFGKQEGASIVGIATTVSGIFAVHAQEMYSNGNSSYFADILSAAAAIGLFLLVVGAMRASGYRQFVPFLKYALGNVPGSIAAGILVGALLMTAAAPLSRALLALSRFVYVESESWTVMLYIAPVVVAVAWLGLETIVRTARLWVWLLLLSIVLALIWAASGFETYRLLPILGDGAGNLLAVSLHGISRFCPALVAWLCVSQSAQGLENTKRVGLIGGIAGGTVAACTQFCLGMTYTYDQLAQIKSPMYRLTMMAKTGNLWQRLDKILLFFWVTGLMLSAAYYVYAAALLFALIFGQKDVRPAVASMGTIVASLSLIAHLNVPWYEAFSSFIIQYGWAFFVTPLAAGAVAGFLRSKMQTRKERIGGNETEMA